MNEELAPPDIAALIVSPKAYAAQSELMAGFRWLRRNNPVARVEIEDFDPFWAVTRHADIVAISREHDAFHNGDRASTLVPRAADELARSLRDGSPHLMRTLLQMDAPDHARYRQITQAWFAQRSLESFEARIRPLARASIDRMAAYGSTCDFVRDVAVYYPLEVIMDLLGLPECDAPVLLGLSQELFRSQDEAPSRGSSPSRDPARHARRLLDAFSGFEAYFDPVMKDRRCRPRADLASVIANAVVNGRPIGRFEAISYYMVLATAGHHTAAAALSGAVRAMCENAEELGRVKADRRLVPQLVEEAVRWTTPAQHVMRTATQDRTMHGRRIVTGDWIMLCYLSGNRDEAAFDDPDRFRIQARPNRSLAFGYGAHACLGQHLARLEMRVFFEELLDRLRGIEIAGTPRRVASVFVGGLRALPVRFSMM